MTLRVVGAGLGRTGTQSLQLALERLLGVSCYHMNTVFEHEAEHVPVWHAAAQGHMPDWQAFFAGYGAVVDWPAASFWPELSAAFPNALVLLSVRDPLSWWQSAHATIFPQTEKSVGTEWHAMFDAVLAARFTTDIGNEDACIAAFERHNAQVRASVPAHRLLEWRASEGWQPLCAALDLPVPDEPFPHINTRAEFITGHDPS